MRPHDRSSFLPPVEARLDSAIRRAQEAEAALARETSARERVEAALRPFAAFDPPKGCGTRDECVVYGSNVTGTMTEITVGDFRRARAALAGSSGGATT